MDTSRVNPSAAGDDTAWGPQLGHSFDFTLRFEQTVFTLIPSCAFILCSPYYIWKVYRGARLARSGYLFWLKLISGFLIFAFEVAFAALWGTLADYRTDLGLGASALSCLAASSILVAICAEHYYSVRPSRLLGLFLAITTLLDATKVYSLFRRSLHIQGSIVAAIVAFKVALLILEEISKRKLLIDGELEKETGREAVSGFWGRAFYLWLNTTFWKGYKSLLTIQDLDRLDLDLKAKGLYEKFQHHWEASQSNNGRRLLSSLLKTIGPAHLAFTALACLLTVASSYAQPFIIKKVVEAMAQRDLESNVQASLIGATALSYFSFAIARAVNQQLLARSTVAFRACSIMAIFEKMMMLDEPLLRQSGSITLMTADVIGLQELPLRINNALSSLASITGGMVYLAFNIGEGAVLVVVPITVCTIMSYFLAGRVKVAQKDWNSKVESRVASIQIMLENFKSIKMMGLNNWFSGFINDKLKVEIDASRKFRSYQSIVFGVDISGIGLTPLIVMIGTYCWTRPDGLSIAETYGLLAVASLIGDPLGRLIQTLPGIARPLACHDRIQTFLLLDNIVDSRQEPVPTDNSTDADTPNQGATVAARINNLDAKPFSDGQQIFQMAEATILKNKLTMVTGEVGSGKSTFLRLLLGEVPTVQGQIEIETATIAYCGQTPWLRNQSVRDNILGTNPMSDKWYETVTEACALKTDFDLWPLRDETSAGDAGTNLSGGQKQRVALARAIYSRKPMLVLDDVFSGLDAQTAHQIFDALLGESGILTTSNRTIVLATNSVEYLPAADLVLRLEGNKIISEPNASPSTEGISRRHSWQRDGDNSVTQSNETVEAPGSPNKLQKHENGTQATNDKQETSSNAETVVSKERPAHLVYFASFGVLQMTIWLILTAVGELFFKCPNIFLRIWFQDHTTNDRRFLVGYSLITISAILFASIYIWWFLARLIANSYQTLHSILLQTTMQATSRFIAATGSGDILSRFSQDVGFVSQELPYTLLHAVMFIFAVLVDLGVIASGADYAAVIVPLLVALLFLVQRFYLCTSRQIRLLQLEAMTPIYTLCTEVVSGIVHIRAFQWQHFIVADFGRYLDHAQIPHYQMLCLQQWLFLVLDMSVVGIATVVVSLALCLRDKASANGLGLALVNLITFSQGMSAAIRQGAECETSLGAVTRIHNFATSTPMEPPTGASDAKISKAWPEKGGIEFTDVSIRYNPEELESAKVLNNVTFTAQPGQRIGIVGRSGSGKSSLLMAFLQMLPYEGTIHLDGVDLATVSCELARSRITTISQDSVALQASISVNLYPYARDEKDTVDDGLFIDILKQVGLWECVAAGGGLDAEVGILQLSEGQLQLLNIARGMVHHLHTKSTVAVMDEISSQLDYAADKRVQEALNTTFSKCTMLVIAHRTETLKDMDMILTLSDGYANMASQTRQSGEAATDN